MIVVVIALHNITDKGCAKVFMLTGQCQKNGATGKGMRQLMNSKKNVKHGETIRVPRLRGTLLCCMFWQ